jgi:hypothetical protein
MGYHIQKPSDFLLIASGKLRRKITQSIADTADEYQKQNLPGKPSVTLAAFIHLENPEYTKTEICEVFQINVKSITAREWEIHRKGLNFRTQRNTITANGDG